MEAYAVVETGGKQYFVRKGEPLKVEKLGAEAGSKIVLDRVLAISDGQTLKVGTPVVEGAAIEIDVVGDAREKKVVSFKVRRRKGYKRKMGHRQTLTQVKVAAIRG